MDFVFKGGISKGVYVTDRGAFWKMPSKDHRMYSKQSIKAVFDFVIDNEFFQVFFQNSAWKNFAALTSLN